MIIAFALLSFSLMFAQTRVKEEHYLTRTTSRFYSLNFKVKLVFRKNMDTQLYQKPTAR
jgi:hypothetical protein